MRAVNLLPKDGPRRTGPPISTPVAATVIGGLVLVSLMISVLLLSAHGKVKSRELELAQKQAELAAIPVPAQSRLPMPIEDFTVPVRSAPASVMPRPAPSANSGR